MSNVDYNQEWYGVLREAVETAKFFGYRQVTPGCILIGLIRRSGTLANLILINEKIDFEKTLAVVVGLESICSRRDVSTTDMPYTKAAESVVENAKKSGEEMNHSYRGPEHLVCGLARCEDIGFREILGRLGTNGKILESSVRSCLGFGGRAVA